MLHVLRDRLLPDRLLDLALRLDVERVAVQSLDLPLLLELRAVLPLARLPKELGEARGVVLRGGGEVRLRLGRAG